ncbi:hypothetical protein Tco_1528451, partial [Tanacetum coccineum]
DLFLFARSDVAFARVIMDSLDEFKAASGLVPSKLPVKYLGVPLISSRLLNRDCKFLVESAKNRIGDWKNKSLSFAGRLQLCKSVISSMQVYWASVLAIPKAPNLNQISVPILAANSQDATYWRDLNGKQYEFSIKCA